MKINQAMKGTNIYTEDEPVYSVSIIIKGRILAVNEGSKVLLGSGTFIGVNDLHKGRFINSYIAYDDVSYYTFSINRTEDLMNIIRSKKEYKGLLVTSLLKYLCDVHKVYIGLKNVEERAVQFVKSNYDDYKKIGRDLGYYTQEITSIEELNPYDGEYDCDNKRIEYYGEGLKVPLAVWESFCEHSDLMTHYILEEISDVITQLLIECKELAVYLVDLLELFLSDGNHNLFSCYADLAFLLQDAGKDNGKIMSMIDLLIDEINRIEKILEDQTGQQLLIDRTKMEEIYFKLLTGEPRTIRDEQNLIEYDEEDILRQSTNSLGQILAYSGLEADKAKEFEQSMADFINLKDKNSIDDSVRLLRKKLSEQFYKIYELIFFKSVESQETPKTVDLFLRYGYLDERILTKEQLCELFSLVEDTKDMLEGARVFHIKDWLKLIYLGEREPSKNEFDMDYTDHLREQRKRGDITVEEEKEFQSDLAQKVRFELHNMFRYNHRTVHGKISTFIPFLWSENLLRGIHKLRLTSDMVNQALLEILSVDYSVFHRESMYVDNEKGIEKEYIMEQVYPDVILFPTVGFNGVMWQEISGKRKSSHGRFLLPILSEANLNEVMVRLCGRFRWELCRTIQGSAWNNMKYKSLTSEYADYIQFYRKNHELSEEVKGKLKSQIQKGKNNLREVFLIDYEIWIRNESGGAMRLNKVVRGILATYVPFRREIRIKLGQQPLFATAMEQFGRNTTKKAKDLETRYRMIEKEGGELTEKLIDTLHFYKEL